MQGLIKTLNLGQAGLKINKSVARATTATSPCWGPAGPLGLTSALWPATRRTSEQTPIAGTAVGRAAGVAQTPGDSENLANGLRPPTPHVKLLVKRGRPGDFRELAKFQLPGVIGPTFASPLSCRMPTCLRCSAGSTPSVLLLYVTLGSLSCTTGPGGAPVPACSAGPVLAAARCSVARAVYPVRRRCSVRRPACPAA